MVRTLVTASAVAIAALSGTAQAWDPQNGDWLKSDETDLRVMTWNVQDAICTTEDKTNGSANAWNAIARIVATLQPDVLILQETGDNSGNGTGGGVDPVSSLTTVCELLMHGGSDPFEGGTVESYVQLYAPAYDLPYIFVSGNTDNFNRNIIMSRYPFADITANGDSTYSQVVTRSDAWQPGGTGGIRGWTLAEIDLPDGVYAGDVVVGNSHLKAGGSSSDATERVDAAMVISYVIQYFYNGNQTGTPNPTGQVTLPRTLAGTSVLDDNTPVIWGGDLNDQPGGAKGPAEWMTDAQSSGGTTDGTDRDGTDSTRDNASHPITGDSSTQGSSSKLDYLIWQDSIATDRRQFVFRTSGSGMSASQLPGFAWDSYPSSPVAGSTRASDHRPVIVDFQLPLADTEPCLADLNGDGALNNTDINLYIGAFLLSDPVADFNGDGAWNNSDINLFIAAFVAGC